MKSLSREVIVEALNRVASELEADEGTYQLVIAGGAALVLLYGARESTKDVDVIQADRAVRDAGLQIAKQLGLPRDWLNDGAKGYESGRANLDASPTAGHEAGRLA